MVDMRMTDDETEIQKKVFQDNLLKREKAFLDKGIKATPEEYYRVMRGAIWDTFKGYLIKASLMTFVSDIGSVAFSAYLMQLVAYLYNVDGTVEEGITALAIYGVLMFVTPLVRNQFFAYSMATSVIFRKTVISATYDKISKLSMQSINKIDSGKLITIISGDI